MLRLGSLPLARSAFLVVSLLIAGQAGAQTGPIPADAHLKGMWSPVTPWPVIGIHAVLLPEGRVLTYGTDTNGRQTGFFTYDVWDPAAGLGAGHLTLPNGTGTDIFCGSQLVLPHSGAGVLLAGGDNWTGTSTTNTGNNNTNIFNSTANTLTRANNMNRARWYSTATTLANGETYIQGGTGGADLPEIRSASGTFRLLSNANTSGLHSLYPRNFVAPDGRVFGFDSSGVMYYVDSNGLGSATTVGQLPAPNRGGDASAAMFQPGRILQYGGASNGAVVIDITGGGTPVVTPTQSMSSQRRLSTATLLADGKVVATGGSAVWNQMTGVNTAAEIWNPATGTWTLGAAGALARLYHSTALMLPDATVLVAGGGAPGPLTNLNVEIYYPPYLFRPNGTLAPRPSIALAPELLQLGESFALDVAGAAGISRVTLVKTGSVTHGWNMEQRFLELGFSANGGSLSVQAPARSTDAPPGTYLLFVIDSAGVPSVGRIVRIEPAAASNQAPTVNAGPDRAINLPSTALLTGTATDDGLPNPPGAMTRNWTKVSGPGTVTFSAPTALTTTASFSTSGFYVLRLTVSDGALTASDDVTVTVNPVPATGTGLTGRYYNDPGTGTKFTTLVRTRIDARVNFDWVSGSPVPGVVKTDNFSVRWTGQLQAPVTGNYTFSTVSDDGVRLWVNGVLRINNWTNHAPTTNTSAPIALVGGVKYSVVMEYYERTGGAVARLRWAYPGQGTQAIPQSRLFP
ncbi:MAG TPA: PA14 domain-containing protein [Burkholderiales bacterium]|nr:PA14 domain-containing protein [Burkholderiales bacterium]